MPFDYQRSASMSSMQLFRAEAIFFLFIIPVTILMSGIETIVGIPALVTLPWRREKALVPWRRIRQSWTLILRHMKYITFYTCSSKYRKMVNDRKEAVRKQLEKMYKMRVPSISLELPEVDFVNVGMVLALMPQIFSLTTILGNAAVAVFWMIATWGVWHYVDTPVAITEPPPEVKVVYEPQIADQQEADYGPWFNKGEVFKQTREPDFLNLVLLSDTGSAKYSQMFRGDLAGFTPQSSEKIIAARLTESGQITFKDQHGNSFTINPDQVFLIENYKSFAFVFDSEGNLHLSPLTDLTVKELN